MIFYKSLHILSEQRKKTKNHGKKKNALGKKKRQKKKRNYLKKKKSNSAFARLAALFLSFHQLKTSVSFLFFDS